MYEIEEGIFEKYSKQKKKIFSKSKFIKFLNYYIFS